MTNPPILYEVKYLSNIASRKMERLLAVDSADNPTGMQSFILGYLGDNQDRDIFQRDVEKEFQIRRPTATGILKLMEKNGLIKRHLVERDQRLKKLELTPKALNIHKHVVNVIHSVDKIAESGLTAEEIETFRAVMHKIIKNIEGSELQC